MSKTMADEYIRRQDAVDAISFGITYATAFDRQTGEAKPLFESENKELMEAIERVNALPAVTPKPRTGKWIRHENADIVDGYYVPEFECSKCHDFAKDDSDFCPNCGAKMQEESE